MIYTPKTLAKEWGCSDRHIRNLVNSGALKAFWLGDKLIRIKQEWAEDFLCKNTSSSSSEARTTSRSEKGQHGGALRSAPQTRLELRSLRREFIGS